MVDVDCCPSIKAEGWLAGCLCQQSNGLLIGYVDGDASPLLPIRSGSYHDAPGSPSVQQVVANADVCGCREIKACAWVVWFILSVQYLLAAR